MSKLENSNIKDIYRLSPMQEGMYFHHLYNKQSSAYFSQTSYRLKGSLDIETIKMSLDKLLERYDILRTVYNHERLDIPLQIVLKNIDANFIYEDIRNFESENEKECFVTEFKNRDKELSFDLNKDILFRVSIIQILDNEYEFIWSSHHILMDGWCLSILISNFLIIYDSLINKIECNLPETTQYRSYIDWIYRQDETKYESYWKNYLENYNEVVTIPKMKTNTVKDESYIDCNLNLYIDKNTTEGLNKIAKNNQVTLNAVIQVIWGILLGKYNHTSDIVFGAVVSGRPPEIEGIETMVGLFINTVPVRIKCNPDMQFNKLVQQTHYDAALSDNYNYCSLAKIQSYSELKKELFNNILVFQNFPVVNAIKNIVSSDESSNGLSFQISDVDSFDRTSYDFNLIVAPQEELLLMFQYNGRVYNSEWVKCISNHFKCIIDQVVKNESIEIEDINIITDQEEDIILNKFNDTELKYTEEHCLHQYFEMQVEKTPDEIAIIFEDNTLTYRQLNERSNKLARELRKHGVVAESVVAIALERSLEMPIAIMAVEKAGAAYLPISIEYPEDRINYMMQDSGAEILIVHSKHQDRINVKGRYICIDDESIFNNDGTNLENINEVNNLSYIIYTSGSTGKPKGAMIEHHSIVNRLKWMQRKYPIGTDDVILQKTPYTFDVSVWEIFWWSMVGAKVCYLIPGGEKNPEEIVKAVKRNKITVMHFVPSMLSIFLDYVETMEDISELSSLKQVFSSGEALMPSQVERFNRLLNDTLKVKLANLYGPTEATVDVSYFDCSEDRNLDVIPIGKPIDNIKLVILDEQNNLAPIGVSGELCILGKGVGRGYINNVELTGEKFVDSPFTAGDKMYYTGDIARWMVNGEVEYLGRKDGQVKIRGFRIELQEVEEVLLQYEKINKAVVVTRKEKERLILCAYVVGKKALSLSELRSHLVKSLPEYMIPSIFIQLDDIPLTSNGKLNRDTIESLKGTQLRPDTAYAEVKSESEEIILKIFKSVLGREDIGVNDNFFELGGTSIDILRINSKLKKALKKDILVSEIFEYPTIALLNQYIHEKDKIDSSKEEKNKNSEKYKENIPSAEIKEHYPLSSAQKRLYVLNQLDQNDIVYNITEVLIIEESLDKTFLENIIKTIVDRHESLRTSFHVIDGMYVQKVHKNLEVPIEYKECNEEEVSLAIKEFVKPFDLSKAPLIRIGIIKLLENKFIILFDMHHIISDGTSVQVLLNEFYSLYVGEKLPEIKHQYKDFAVWQQLNYEKIIKKQEEYWLNQFKGDIPILNMPYDYSRPQVKNNQGDYIDFYLDSEKITKIRELAKQNNTTLYITLLAAVNVLLSKYSGQDDIIVGSPIAGRNHSELENVIGMFVNTLAIRNYPKSNMLFVEFMNEVKMNAIMAYENEDYQFEELVEKLNIRTDLSRNPLFDVMLILENKSKSNLDKSSINLKRMEFRSYTSKFDILIAASELEDKLEFILEYSTSIYKRETMNKLCNHFMNIIDIILESPEIKLEEIEIIDKSEREKVLIEFNNTASVYEKNKTISELFEVQVNNVPDSIAVVLENESLTYSELNKRANSLANLLRDKGVKSDSVVGIMVDRSLEMIIGIMAIIKAGGAYCPIDSTYPAQRINYILDDSGCEILLSTENLIENLSFRGEIIDLSRKDIYNRSGENLLGINNSDDLVYVIYTSGTMGNPKGTMIKHSNLNNFITSFNKNFSSPIGVHDKVLSLTNYVFDVSVCEIFIALLNGSTLIINDKHKTFDPTEICNLIVKYGTTFTYIPPLLLSSVCEELMKVNTEIKLNKLLIGVEAIQGKTINKFKELNKDIEIINGYGPTESTICSTFYKVKECEIEDRAISIGRPAQNTKIYILNKYNNIQPIGLAGELYISGEGVARGYLNNPDLTVEKFVKNQFDEGVMYRTGDLARWCPDGNLEFLGRIDNQVKIRGLRIELGEIESKLLQHNDVKEATVMVVDGKCNDKLICAYIVSRKELNELNLESYLYESLPDYMIPSFFIQVENIPLTSNGKIDRNSLPKPKLEEKLTTYEAPRNDLEKTLATIWSEVLGVENIGINDNFFELGGQSIKAMILFSKIHKETNKKLHLKELFKAPTIKEISEVIKSTDDNLYTNIQKIEEKLYYESSPAQKRMYLIQSLDKDSIAYNMPQCFEVIGLQDKSKIANVFKKLVERHEVLKTYFEIIQEEIVQKVDYSHEFHLQERIEVRALEEAFNDFIKPFDLGKAPLYRIELVEILDKTYLFIDMHHIISDGVSMNILISDFAKLYNDIQLEELRIQYKDFAQWQNNYLNSEAVKSQEAYWLSVYEDDIPSLELPYDYEGYENRSFNGESIEFEIDNIVTNKLKKLIAKTGTTMHMVVLSAFNILLSKYSGQEDIIVGVPITGRKHLEVNNILGMFVNTLAIRNKPQGMLRYIDFLEEVKENSIKAYDNQDYQIESLIQKLNIVRVHGKNPLFNVTFNTLNIENETIELNEMTMKPMFNEDKIAKFDLNLFMLEDGDILQLDLVYCQDLFNRDTIEMMKNDLIDILTKITDDQNLLLLDIIRDNKIKENYVELDAEFNF